MDTVRTKQKTFPLKTLLGASLVVAVLASYWAISGRVGTERRVARDLLTIRTVTEAPFFEYVNLNGLVSPRNRQFLDCKMAGTVEQVFVESGDEVKEGDTLLRLSNAELELEVMQRESELIEQLNGQRQTALLLNQNDFNRRAEIIENNYQLALERKRYNRADTLLSDGIIAPADYEPTAARLSFFTAQQALLRDAYQQDSVARRVQLAQISRAEARLLANLQAVRALLKRLWITAPTNGKLDQFNVVAGQTLTPGQRLGELYELTDPFIEATVDEFYLNRIRTGQAGIVPHKGDTLAVAVDKVFPSIEGGRFRIRLRFAEADQLSTQFIKGQSLRFRLLFGESTSSTLLANGDFYTNTGGNWVFVVADNRASRRTVALGRRNPEYYEVLTGLDVGEQVITSGYDLFKDDQNITLTK
ncbi:MAG: efflux RND transporter periplasmic adaptor subunit [Bacteroidota bacterium]